MGSYTNNVLVLRWLLLPCALTAGCSFLATNFDAESAVGREAFTRANYHARFRGPDATTVRHRSGWTFVHNLLAMTGTFTPQPFVAAGATIVCGESWCSSKPLGSSARTRTRSTAAGVHRIPRSAFSSHGTYQSHTCKKRWPTRSTAQTNGRRSPTEDGDEAIQVRT